MPSQRLVKLAALPGTSSAMSRPVPPEAVMPAAALAPLEPGEDSVKGSVEEVSELVASDSPIEDEPIVSRKELWSYYLYYNGDNVRDLDDQPVEAY
ncbi:hypothetical protein GY45DRAFT_68131 [Cubamyces sp. BRFM 1775]|nr:hypothetical protein GY45DRAFT_68131 [Cubamyces sp. BRFM 1775]